MSRRAVPAAMRRRLLVESRGRCAYCRTATAISGARLVIDHIVPEAAGGPTKFDNLCLACHSCNEFKGAQVGLQDPDSHELIALFHPRRQSWSDHFCWSPDGSEIIGTTSVGRATILALNLNHPLIVEARRRWVAVGWHPPAEDL